MAEREKTATHILVMNGGSSSLKFCLFSKSDPPEKLFCGNVDRIGLNGSEAGDHVAATNLIIGRIEERLSIASIAAAGHRIVHGGEKYTAPTPVTTGLLDALGEISPYDPDHLPAQIAIISRLRELIPGLPQIACFDTAFHRDMPAVAQIVPIPRRFREKGVRRYGFHGISYSFLMRELSRAAEKEARGRVILAHLGNGASLAAVLNGKSVDTSMGFTPAAGIPMSTRSGDLDPGLVWYLNQAEGIAPADFNRMINKESGLLGISGSSPDMRDLLDRESRDPAAKEAIAHFCYQVRKWIGAFAAAMGGVDALVFSGGIGENSPVIRERICNNLEFLGITLDPSRNTKNSPLVSSAASKVSVRVIRTDEEQMIAAEVFRLLSEASRRNRSDERIPFPG